MNSEHWRWIRGRLDRKFPAFSTDSCVRLDWQIQWHRQKATVDTGVSLRGKKGVLLHPSINGSCDGIICRLWGFLSSWECCGVDRGWDYTGISWEEARERRAEIRDGYPLLVRSTFINGQQTRDFCGCMCVKWNTEFICSSKNILFPFCSFQ